MNSRIPRRASRNLWQRFKRWWHSGTVIRFNTSTRRGMMIAYRYPEKKDIKQ